MVVGYNKVVEKQTTTGRKVLSKHKRKVSIYSADGSMRCGHCNGSGHIDLSDTKYMVCGFCEGRGFYRVGCSLTSYLGDIPCTCALCCKTDSILGVDKIRHELSSILRNR